MSTLHVRHLSLVDFRNYASLDVDIPDGITAFLGPNGQGKTNIVEAVSYLATLGSHRVATDAPLVRHGASAARVSAQVVREERALTIEVEIIPGRANRARINATPASRPRDILGILRTVVFAPEDLALVKGDPAERRRMLDDLMVQRQPRMAGVRGDYERVLKQRNALLKSAGGARRANMAAVDATLAVWDEQLVDLGAQIMLTRRELVEALAPLAGAEYAALAPQSRALELHYAPGVVSGTWEECGAQAAGDSLRESLLQRRREELDRGLTLSGPHRDDLLVTIGDSPVKGYASHGESWSAALALRLAAFDLLCEDVVPVLVLDDVFAELDVERRRRLAARVTGSAGVAPQVLITAAVPQDVPAELTATWFDVRKDDEGLGEVRPHVG